MPATLAVDAVLQRDEGIVVAVPHLDVFPNGFRINLLMLLDPHRAEDSDEPSIEGQRLCRGSGSGSLTAASGSELHARHAQPVQGRRRYSDSADVGFAGGGGGGAGGHSVSGCIHSHPMVPWRSSLHFPHPPPES